jgi:hypothetical protein
MTKQKIKKRIMKIAMLLLSLVSTVTMYGQADFTGSWKLNPEKSQFNNTPGAPAAGKLVVEQKNGTVSFQRNDRPKETLKIDSTASIEISDGGIIEGSQTQITMKPTPDKKGLIETRTYTYPEEQTKEIAIKKTRTWTLSTDKKTLTIQDYIETNKGHSHEMILVYERQ